MDGIVQNALFAAYFIGFALFLADTFVVAFKFQLFLISVALTEYIDLSRLAHFHGLVIVKFDGDWLGDKQRLVGRK